MRQVVRRDLGRDCRTDEIEELHDGGVEVERALFDELERGDRGEQLRDRGDIEARLERDGRVPRATRKPLRSHEHVAIARTNTDDARELVAVGELAQVLLDHGAGSSNTSGISRSVFFWYSP